MSINKSQRSMNFGLSASQYINIFFSETCRPITLNKDLLNLGKKTFTNGFSHMNKIVATPIYGMKTFKNLL